MDGLLLALLLLAVLLTGAWAGTRFAQAGHELDTAVAQFRVSPALVAAREARVVLEMPPEDIDAGYTDDEIAAHYAATDRLLIAFRQLEQEMGCA